MSKLPDYVKLEHTALRRAGRTYYRDNGKWGVKYKQTENGLISWSPNMPHLHEVPLIEITKEEWSIDNGYIHEINDHFLKPLKQKKILLPSAIEFLEEHEKQSKFALSKYETRKIHNALRLTIVTYVKNKNTVETSYDRQVKEAYKIINDLIK